MSIQNINYSDLEKLIQKSQINKVYDMHKSKAAEIFDKDVAEVTMEEREYAKSLNYLSLYSSHLPIK